MSKIKERMRSNRKKRQNEVNSVITVVFLLLFLSGHHVFTLSCSEPTELADLTGPLDCDRHKVPAFFVFFSTARPTS